MTLTDATQSIEYYTGSVSLSENGSFTSLSVTSYTGSSTNKTITLSKSTCGTTDVNESTITITAVGANTTTQTIVQSQNKDKATYTMVYDGTPTLTIGGSGFTAGGGSVTLSGNVSNKKQYY